MPDVTHPFLRNQTAEQLAATRLRLFAQALGQLPTDLATGYAHQVLAKCPLTHAVPRCQIGGLLPDHWMPLRFQAKEAVIALHGGDVHFAQFGHHTVVVPNTPREAA